MNNIQRLGRMTSLFVLAIIALRESSVAQIRDFSGTWILRDRKSLVGKDYSNVMPKEISVSQNGDSLIIQRELPGEHDILNKFTETVYLDGRKSTRVTGGKRNVTASIKPDDKTNEFTELMEFTFPNNNQDIEYSRSEKWSLSETGTNLSIVNESASERVPEHNWKMKGDYEKISTPDSANAIRFEKGLMWNDILQKAKVEQKYIFVDCYTTWCAPCKEMERDVYSSPLVANAMNSEFISVKVQMDSTSNDDKRVKAWYSIANQFQQMYNVNAYPTFLFFSPDGVAIHEDIGYKQVGDFLKVIKTAKDPNEQYFRLLSEYKGGRLANVRLKVLAYTAKRLGYEKLANDIALNYVDNYLVSLPENEFYKRENLEFVADFPKILNLESKVFKLIYAHGDKVDSIMEDERFRIELVNYVARKKWIEPELSAAGSGNREPEWSRIYAHIRSGLNADWAELNVVSTKVKWYKEHRRWKDYTAALVQEQDLYRGGKGVIYYKLVLNNAAWEIFSYSFNRQELARAVSWSESVINADSTDFNSMDTRANLLYKLGEKESAIRLEERAIEIGHNKEGTEGVKQGSMTSTLQSNLQRMKHDMPTWKMSENWKPIWRPADNPLYTRWAKDVTPGSALSEYPRPQMVRKQWENLNGLWDYAVTDSGVVMPSAFEGQILVPYPIESALSGVKRALKPNEKLWYRRTIEIGDTMNGNRVLHFGAIDWEAAIYVNEKMVGRHKGGYTSFDFDISRFIKKGKNELIICVLDPTDQGGNPHGKQALDPGGIVYTATSGIWQTVWLEPLPEKYISNLVITPSVDSSCVSLATDVFIGESGYSIEVSAFDHGAEVAKGIAVNFDTDIKGGNIARYQLNLNISEPHLWSPRDPFLYDLVIKLVHKGKVIDQIGSYFGMRKVEIKRDSAGKDRIFLNGRYIFNLGVLDQGFWPDGVYTAPTDAALRFDIETIKNMGFNAIRKHIKVEPARWYYYCDKIGLLVWQDMPNPASLTDDARDAFERENRIIMHQLHNYPSIICWVLFNEGWNSYDQERLTKAMKQADPGRLINGHSGQNYDRNSSTNPDQRWVGSDLADIHDYPGPGIAPELPGKARVLGEWGGVKVISLGHEWKNEGNWGYITNDAYSFAEKYRYMTKHLKLFEEEGLSASIYTQPFDVETEENGLITYDRELIKIPIEEIKSINNIILHE